MDENELSKVARVANHAAQGYSYLDKNDQVKIVRPTGPQRILDMTKILASGGSDNTGGGDNPDHPDAGVDYYAGSLADGEITGRDLLAQVTTDDPTISNKITFVQNVGAKVNMVGDGITIIGHVQKQVNTKGVLGDISPLNLNYDPANVVKEGYFTTTSPYPIYIKQSDIIVGKKLEVPINGIGEGLSGKNVAPTKLYLTFNDDNTVLIEHEMGYDNDGDSTGASGANYQFIIEAIATFSTQAAVAQLPASVNAFSGSTFNKATTSGITDYFENAMDGITVYFDSYIYSNINVITAGYRYDASGVTSNRSVRIPLDYLINGYQFDASSLADATIAKNDSSKSIPTYMYSSGSYSQYFSRKYYYRGLSNSTLTVGKASITDNVKVDIESYTNSASSINGKASWNSEQPSYWAITRIAPYKN